MNIKNDLFHEFHVVKLNNNKNHTYLLLRTMYINKHSEQNIYSEVRNVLKQVLGSNAITFFFNKLN